MLSLLAAIAVGCHGCLHVYIKHKTGKSNTLHYISRRWHQYYISLVGDKYTFTFEYQKIKAPLVVKQMNIFPSSQASHFLLSLNAICLCWMAELIFRDNTHMYFSIQTCMKWAFQSTNSSKAFTTWYILHWPESCWPQEWCWEWTWVYNSAHVSQLNHC